MAYLTTQYQRDHLKREKAIGVIAIYKGDDEWEFVVVDSAGGRLTTVGPFASDNDATKAGFGWCATNYPDTHAIALA